MNENSNNKVFENIIEFSRRHRWAKYPCVCAAGIVYGKEIICRKLSAVARNIYDDMSHSLVGRAVSAVLAAAFAMMNAPLAVFADEIGTEDFSAGEYREAAPAVYEDPVLPAVIEDNELFIESGSGDFRLDLNTGSRFIVEEPVSEEEYISGTYLPEAVIGDNSYELDILEVQEQEAAEPSDDEEYKVNIVGLPLENAAYSITLDRANADSSVTIELISGGEEGHSAVVSAFEGYSLSCDDLNIDPLNITLYDSEGSVCQLSEGDVATVSVPVPADMTNHLEDLKVIRLDGNEIVILDSEYVSNDNGDVNVVFETEHFSVFALVAYADEPEDMSSSAGADGGSTPISAAAGTGSLSTSPIINRSRAAARKRKYRIRTVIKKNDRIF